MAITLPRIAGTFYAATFIAGISALLLRGVAAAVAGGVAALSYVAVTVLFYALFKPASPFISLLAAIVSLMGIAAGLLRLVPFNTLGFFGVYCALLAYLVLRTPQMPRLLAGFLVLAAVGWLTFVLPVVAAMLYPYNFLPGIIGEGALTVWLLAFSGNDRKSGSLAVVGG
jgi:uncharacterized protein DUF4386